MAYSVPAVQVFQEFDDLPVAALHPLNAHITGPNGQLVRFNVAGEQSQGFLDYYQSAAQTCYSYPNQPAGSLIDSTYTKIWAKNALLQYFSDMVSEGSDVYKVGAQNNQVRSPTLSFKTNGTYARSSAFYDRDVQLGDIVKVRAVVSAVEYVLWTYVNGFVGDAVAAIVGAAAGAAGNATNQSASSTAVQTAGPTNCVSMAGDASLYEGRPSGYINETYTIVVLKSSVGGIYSTASLRVISASGTDNVASLTPALLGQPTAIGTRGLKVTFHVTPGSGCSISSLGENVSPVDLIAGQTWTVTVHQVFVSAVASSGGTYAGPVNTTYIVTVTSGGAFGVNTPLISVTTTTGVDLSGPTSVVSASTAYAVGTQGVTISFTGAGLCAGDIYTIVATAQAVGPMRTLILGNNLNTAIPGSTEVDLFLFILKPTLQIEQNRIGYAPLTNWTQSPTQICLNSGIVAYDPTWTNLGVLLPLPLTSSVTASYGGMYVEYRAWLPDLVNEVGSINDISLLSAQIGGQLDPDNPLMWGVAKALGASNGTAVLYTAVSDPTDTNAWNNALAVIAGRMDSYGLVPLTHNATVQALWQAHVVDMSNQNLDQWRTAWFALQDVPEKVIVNQASSLDGNVVLAVIEDNPAALGIQYTMVRVTSGNGDFVTNSVKAGDIVRYLYTGDGFGNYTYTEYVVASIVNNDELVVVTGSNTGISTPQKVEVWRNLSADDESAAIALQAGAYGSRLIQAVWPDTIDSGSTTMDGYFLCCALAGLVSGVVPQQGLTNLQVPGFTGVPRTTGKFNRSQLDTMAGAGVWIVTQDPNTGTIYTRHAVTTGDTTQLSQREEMIRRNTDSISFRFKEELAPFIGVTNAVPSMLNVIKIEAQALIEVLKSELYTTALGGQVTDGTVTSVAVHATLLDRIVLQMSLILPVPLNDLEVHLEITL